MWLVTYIKVNDYNAQQYTETISAATYTQALVNFLLKYKNYIAIEIKKI